MVQSRVWEAMADSSLKKPLSQETSVNKICFGATHKHPLTSPAFVCSCLSSKVRTCKRALKKKCRWKEVWQVSVIALRETELLEVC